MSQIIITSHYRVMIMIKCLFHYLLKILFEMISLKNTIFRVSQTILKISSVLRCQPKLRVGSDKNGSDIRMI